MLVLHKRAQSAYWSVDWLTVLITCCTELLCEERVTEVDVWRKLVITEFFFTDSLIQHKQKHVNKSSSWRKLIVTDVTFLPVFSPTSSAASSSPSSSADIPPMASACPSPPASSSPAAASSPSVLQTEKQTGSGSGFKILKCFCDCNNLETIWTANNNYSVSALVDWFVQYSGSHTRTWHPGDLHLHVFVFLQLLLFVLDSSQQFSVLCDLLLTFLLLLLFFLRFLHFLHSSFFCQHVNTSFQHDDTVTNVVSLFINRLSHLLLRLCRLHLHLPPPRRWMKPGRR